MADAFDLVAFLARSENRVEALLALESTPGTRPDLQERTGIPRATLSRILSDFRDRGLATREGHEFRLTRLGELVAAELRSILDAVGAMQRLVDVREWLAVDEFDFPVGRLSDADVVLASAEDPTAPIRRAEALLADAAEVRLVANSVIPGCLEAVWRAVTAGRQTLEWVTTPAALEVVADDQELTRRTMELLESANASGYVHRDGFPQAVFLVDDVVFTPVKDETGTIQGHVETDDAVVLEWAEGTIEGYRRAAKPLAADLLTA